MQLFRTKGQKILCCPRTKGQWDKLKIMPQDGMGRGSQSKSGPGRGTGQGFDFLPRDGLGRDFDSLSCPVQEYPRTTTGQKGKKSKKFQFLKKKYFIKFLAFLSWTKEQRDMDFFLSRDKKDGVTRICFFLGERDNGTSCPLETLFWTILF